MGKEKTHCEIFKSRVDIWAKKIRVIPTQVRIQSMTRKWASCSTCGWVTFSKDLLNEKNDFQDYVIVHELLHIKIPNHGKLFKSLLSTHYPKWKKFHKNKLSDRLSGFSDPKNGSLVTN